MLERCNISGCKRPVEYQFLLVEDRTIVNSALYCHDDGLDFLERYYSTQRIGMGTPNSGPRGVECDIELLVYDYRLEGTCQVSVRENGGERRLDIMIGPFEVSALRNELERLSAPRPLTHHAMASLLDAFGGQLYFVMVSKSNSSDFLKLN